MSPSLAIDIVEGDSQADAAGVVLREAWPTPSILYTTEYLEWQLRYPGGSGSLPAALASENGEPAGFAGATVRSVRYGNRSGLAAVVSFVGVRPRWQRQGIANRLYAALLETLKERALPLLTFGMAGSAGERTLLRAYSAAGFSIREMGSYPVFGYLRRSAPVDSGEWTLLDHAGLAELQEAVIQCAAKEPGRIWPEWTAAQWDHLCRDPRPRRLIAARHADGVRVAVSLAVQTSYQTQQGIEKATVVENLLVPGQDVSPLPMLLEAAAHAWPLETGRPNVVMLSNPAGYPAEALRPLGIRQTGTVFRGYACSPPGWSGWEEVRSTAVEVV